MKAIALLLSVGMVAGLAGTYLAEAGVPLWVVGLAVLVVLAVPMVAAVRADRKR
ncbi:hypothetical protein GCM10010470_14480 [Saccharopolyspora taberi]|uniref:Secreted protein n=1 Tax=Saccharopolyspora taberi TaxID=60895 RepID=A0ABN3V786_9PSEU